MHHDRARQRIVVGGVEPDQSLRAAMLADVVIVGDERALRGRVGIGLVRKALQIAGVRRVRSAAVRDQERLALARHQVDEVEARLGRRRRHVGDRDPVAPRDAAAMLVQRGHRLAHQIGAHDARRGDGLREHARARGRQRRFADRPQIGLAQAAGRGRDRARHRQRRRQHQSVLQQRTTIARAIILILHRISVMPRFLPARHHIAASDLIFCGSQPQVGVAVARFGAGWARLIRFGHGTSRDIAR
ncbi:hypothetical protein WR25_23371 [Diploscapter pachys]|uniref:Uncharacterized protein n=1 Tax=Diploscapter pachys TaxID=2018661 RepID=A0A2A2JXX4_9BILA|nr:hypothetical protein WR25_23371 [Diploscapter pachys]